jgi:hypothetical protein
MPDTACSVDEFAKLVRPLVGLTVGLTWKGYGSAIFLELGQLTPIESKRRHHAAGEACISVEWDWRVEHDASVLYGSSNTGPQIERGIAGLRGSAIEGVSVAGRVPELTVSFSNGHCLRSMVMVTGEPKWSIKLHDGRWVYALVGELLVGEGASGTTEEEDRAFALAEGVAIRWGTPLAQPALGQCRQCAWFVPIDGEGHLLDYGVCISSESPFDGKAVKCTSGCPAYVTDGT